MVEDELLARLKTVAGAVAVFDTTLPDRYTAGSTPSILLQHLYTTQEVPIDGDRAGSEDRWQVSVRGAKVSAVRSVARSVIDALHGYTSDTISWCGFESWHGTIREDGNPAEYHAPLEFSVHS